MLLVFLDLLLTVLPNSGLFSGHFYLMKHKWRHLPHVTFSLGQQSNYIKVKLKLFINGSKMLMYPK